MDREVKRLRDIDHQDLYLEIMLIKENHLKHLHEDVDEIKQELRDQKSFFQERLDRLDARIWWIMGIAVTTLIGIIVEKLI